jgi:hypothetical protein
VTDGPGADKQRKRKLHHRTVPEYLVDTTHGYTVTCSRGRSNKAGWLKPKWPRTAGPRCGFRRSAARKPPNNVEPRSQTNETMRNFRYITLFCWVGVLKNLLPLCTPDRCNCNFEQKAAATVSWTVDIYKYIYIYIYIYVCICVCIHICMHVCIDLYAYVCMYVCVYVCIYVCMCVYACVCRHKRMDV